MVKSSLNLTFLAYANLPFLTSNTSVQITQRELQYNKIDDVTRKVHNFLTFAFA